MGLNYISRQKTPEELKLESHAAILDFLNSAELTPTAIKKMAEDAKAALVITNDLAAKHEKALCDIADAKEHQKDLLDQNTDLVKQAAEVSKLKAAAEAEIEDSKKKMHEELDWRLKIVAAAERDLADKKNNYKNFIFDSERSIKIEQQKILERKDQAAKQHFDTNNALGIRAAELDKKEQELILKEKKIAELRAAIG